MSSTSHTTTYLRLLISTMSIVSNDFSSHASSIQQAASESAYRLIISLANEEILNCKPQSRAMHFQLVQSLLTWVYTTCAHYLPSSLTGSHEVLVLFEGWSPAADTALPVTSLRQMDHADFPNSSTLVTPQIAQSLVSPALLNTDAQIHPAVAGKLLHISFLCKFIHVFQVNGTFDHLHFGHKCLLTMGAWLAEEKFIISISSSLIALNARKKTPALIQNYSARHSNISHFMSMIAPASLSVVLVPIPQGYGASITDQDVSSVVLSTESQHHGDRIISLRSSGRLQPVSIFVVDVVTGPVPISRLQGEVMVPKLASSYVRNVRAQTSKATIILLNGLTGAGKQTIGEHLACLIPGARLIHNHLLLDPIDALCPRSDPAYLNLRRQQRRLAFAFIHTQAASLPSTSIFTANCSTSPLGLEVAQEFQTAARQCGVVFVPVAILCDPEEVFRRVEARAAKPFSPFKLADGSIVRAIWMNKAVHRYNVEEELVVNVTSMSAHEAASRILHHVRSLT
jgi:phosphopantetheine adenylyltransferase